jgi:hypothetical protein
MKVSIINECGYAEAMLGLSLSHNRPVEDMPEVALKLAGKGGGHDKFLEHIAVWLDISTPRYWWSQMDTYRTGISKCSESTMHTLLKRPLKQSDFEIAILHKTLAGLNNLIEAGDFEQIKVELPEGFLQRRIVATNYKTLLNIIKQRESHRLNEWKFFCAQVRTQAKHFELLRS